MARAAATCPGWCCEEHEPDDALTVHGAWQPVQVGAGRVLELELMAEEGAPARLYDVHGMRGGLTASEVRQLGAALLFAADAMDTEGPAPFPRPRPPS